MSVLDIGHWQPSGDVGRRWHSLQCIGRAGVEAVLLEGASNRFPVFGLARDRGLDPQTAGPMEE